jgi:hypothetical protein
VALTTADVAYGAPLSRRDKEWLLRAMRVANGQSQSAAFLAVTTQSELDALDYWYGTVTRGATPPAPPWAAVCNALSEFKAAQTQSVHYNATHNVMIKIGCLDAQGMPQGVWGAPLASEQRVARMRWTWTEIRMLRAAINQWRRDYGYDEVTGSDGDTMVKGWLLDRNELDRDPELPSEDELCNTLENIYEFRNRIGRTITELEEWKALREKLCGHGIDLSRQERDAIRQSIHQSWLDPGVRVDVDHWVNVERADLCEVLYEDLTRGKHSNDHRTLLTGILQKLGCVETSTGPAVKPARGRLKRQSLKQPKKPSDGALAPLEARWVGWLLQQGWYDKREDAVAHVLRMRADGVFEKWKRQGKTGLDGGAEMLADLERYRRSA